MKSTNHPQGMNFYVEERRTKCAKLAAVWKRPAGAEVLAVWYRCLEPWACNWPQSDSIHITFQGFKEALVREGPNLLQVGLWSAGSWFGSLATGCGRTVSRSPWHRRTSVKLDLAVRHALIAVLSDKRFAGCEMCRKLPCGGLVISHRIQLGSQGICLASRGFFSFFSRQI